MYNLLKLSDKLYTYLLNNGISFNQYGYPIVPRDMFLNEYPDEMIPFFCRNQATHPKSKTVLCSFSNDDRIYTRLSRLDEDIKIYKEYMGISGFDLSPRINWDIRLQKFNILLSQMATIYVGLHGIKFLPNFRVGSWETINALSSYPHHSVFAVGTLGCAKSLTKYNIAYMKAKIYFALPKSLLIYGSLKPEYKTVLDEMNIEYTKYTDFQRTSRRRKKAI